MNREKMIEALAKRMAWAGIAKYDASEDADDLWCNTLDYGQDHWLKVAAAVLDLCGARPLVWEKSDMSGWNGDYHTLPTAYTVRCADENGWRWSRLGYGAYGWEPSPEAAQAAAQSHADEAHWANTPLGKLVEAVKFAIDYKENN